MTKKTNSFLFLITLAIALYVPSPFAIAATSSSADINAPELSGPLKCFAPYIGKTWKGVFSSSENQQKKTIDVSVWERALNGTAVRVLHSVNDGEYGGESLIFYDKKEKQLVFFYFTTAGFYTRGSVKTEENRIISHETVTGNTQGITEVTSTSEILPDGRMKTSSNYLKNGRWVKGHEVLYEQDATAKVVFK